MNSECVTTLETTENTNNTSNYSETFSTNPLSPDKSPKESKTRNNRIMRKPVVKKKIDFSTEGENSETQQQWNSQADSFVFTPNPDPETVATFVDLSSIPQEFCFGSPDNDKSSPKSLTMPNIQQTPLSTVHTPAISTNGPIATKPERVKVLRVPRSEKQRGNTNGVTSTNVNSVNTPPPPPPSFLPDDEDDHDLGSVKRSKRKKDQAFSSSIDQDDTFALIDSDLVEETPTTAAVATHHVHNTMAKNGRLKEEHLFIAKASETAAHLMKKSTKPLRPRIREIHDHDDDSDDDDKKKRTIKKVIRNSRNNDDFAPYSRSSQILARRRKKKEQWEEKEREERDKIKDFWLSLTDQERRELVKLEKEAVLKKMKEQHTCSCSVCGRRRTVIEEELEMLYDAYYEELEHFEEGKQKTNTHSHHNHHHHHHHGPSAASLLVNKSEEDDSFNFGKSLTVKGGILTVADDLLKNDGKKFLEMMERLAERRMRTRDDSDEYDEDEEEEDDYGEEEYDEEEEDEEEEEEEEEDEEISEEQRIEEGRRMFQMFAAKMFEQRVLAAYREKVALENQRKLLAEVEEAEKAEAEKKEKKLQKAKQKKERKKQAKQQLEEKKQQKLKEKQEEDEKRKEEIRKQQEEIRKKKDEEAQRRRQEELERKERERQEREKQQKIEEERRKEKERKKQERLKAEKEKALEEAKLKEPETAPPSAAAAEKKKKKKKKKQSGNPLPQQQQQTAPPVVVVEKKPEAKLVTSPKQAQPSPKKEEKKLVKSTLNAACAPFTPQRLTNPQVVVPPQPNGIPAKTTVDDDDADIDNLLQNLIPAFDESHEDQVPVSPQLSPIVPKQPVAPRNLACPLCGVNQADLVISPCNHILCSVCLTTLQIQHLNFKPVKTTECPYCNLPIQEFKQIPTSASTTTTMEQAPIMPNSSFPWSGQNWAKPGMFPPPGPPNGTSVPNGFGPGVPKLWSPIGPEVPNSGFFVYPPNIVNNTYPSLRPVPAQTWTNRPKLAVPPPYSLPSANPWLSNSMTPYPPPQYVQPLMTEGQDLLPYNPVNVQSTNPQKK